MLYESRKPPGKKETSGKEPSRLFSNAPELSVGRRDPSLATTETLGRLLRWIGYVEKTGFQATGTVFPPGLQVGKPWRRLAPAEMVFFKAFLRISAGAEATRLRGGKICQNPSAVDRECENYPPRPARAVPATFDRSHKVASGSTIVEIVK